MPDSKQMFGKSSGDTPDVFLVMYSKFYLKILNTHGYLFSSDGEDIALLINHYSKRPRVCNAFCYIDYTDYSFHVALLFTEHLR